MKSRQTRIQLLARQNIRRLRLPKFLSDASEVIGETIEPDAVLDIDTTDAVPERFVAGYKDAKTDAVPSFKQTFAMNEERRMLCLVDCLAHSLEDLCSLWLTYAEGEPIAVEIQLAGLLRRCKSAIKYDRDSISASSLDRSQGLLLDHNADDAEFTYELTIWGDQWLNAVRNCELL